MFDTCIFVKIILTYPKYSSSGTSGSEKFPIRGKRGHPARGGGAYFLNDINVFSLSNFALVLSPLFLMPLLIVHKKRV